MRVHSFFRFAVALLVTGLFCGTAAAADPGPSPLPPGTTVVYIGTFTKDNKSKGIYYFRLQTQNSDVSQNILLVPLGVAAETSNPSYLELDLKRRLVFAANEDDEFEGKPTGAISSFSVDPSTGALKLINQVPSMGKGPCHIALDKSGRNLLVANYAGGSIAVIPVAADGRLGSATTAIQFEGKGTVQDRQDTPHAHCATLDAANKFAFFCDLGTDKVMAYHFDADNGKLTPADPPFTSLKAGSGPRHMVFGKDGHFAYVINELNSTITVFAYDATNGDLKELQTISTLPAYYDGPNSTAEIEVHPSGKWVYASNRGHNSVVLFNVDPKEGTLTYVEEQGTGGKKPRHFGIEPSAKHLVICNQDSDTLLVCRIDADNGRLKPSGVFAEAPAPVCAKFLPPAEAGH